MLISPLCFRCKNTELCMAEQLEDCTFFDCKECRRKYCQQNGLGLCDAWPSPLGIALYSMIFERDPVEKAPSHADYLFRAQTSELVRSIIIDIDHELATPAQRVRDIVNCNASETDLRQFLEILSARLKELVESKAN